MRDASEGTASRNWRPSDHVHHGGFVENKQVAGERVAAAAFEVAGKRIELQQSVDGLGGSAGRFRQAFGRSARGRGQDGGPLFRGEDLQDAADQSGLADSGPPGDDQDFVAAGLADGVLLALRQLQPQAVFHPLHSLLDVDFPQRMGAVRRQPADGLGDAELRSVERGQVQPRLALEQFADNNPIGHCIAGRGFYDAVLDLHQFRGPLDDARLDIAAMTLGGQLFQRVADSGPGSLRAVLIDAQLRGQFIRRLEADPPNVVGELIGVGLDRGNGLLSVGAVDPHGAA